jgi:hypothetical protein
MFWNALLWAAWLCLKLHGFMDVDIQHFMNAGCSLYANGEMQLFQHSASSKTYQRADLSPPLGM